jgi:hypothetical protein
VQPTDGPSAVLLYAQDNLAPVRGLGVTLKINNQHTEGTEKFLDAPDFTCVDARDFTCVDARNFTCIQVVFPT